MAPKAKEANPGLNKSQYADLNRTFFENSNPANYFDARLRTLIVLHNGDSAIRKEVNEDIQGVLPQEQDIITDEFLAMEVTNLFHHSVESLWRMILSFDGSPACPQLEMAQLTDSFGKRLTKALKSSEDKRRARIKRVFMFDEPVEDEEDVALYAEILDSIEQLTRAMGHKLLQDSVMYNSAKHGMSVSTNRATISFIVREEGEVQQPTNEELLRRSPLFSRTAIWISYLDTIKRQRRWKWSVVDKPVDVVEVIRLTAMCINLTRTLWDWTQAKYVTQDEPTVGVPRRNVVEDLLSHSERLVAFRRDLLYENDPDPEFSFVIEPANYVGGDEFMATVDRPA